MTRTRDLLTGLVTLAQTATTAPGYVGALPSVDANNRPIDRCWSLSYTNAGTDPLDRWGQGILMLQSRGLPGVPLDADDLAEPIVGVLIRTTGIVLGSVTVTQCIAGPSSRGLDSSKRSVRADRLDLHLDYLTA